MRTGSFGWRFHVVVDRPRNEKGLRGKSRDLRRGFSKRKPLADHLKGRAKGLRANGNFPYVAIQSVFSLLSEPTLECPKCQTIFPNTNSSFERRSIFVKSNPRRRP